MRKVSVPLTCQSKKHHELYAHQSTRKIPDLLSIESGHSPSEIAAILCRHRSTIHPEISRNSGLRGYRPRQAELLASQRSERSRNAPKIGRSLWQSVTELLEEKLSPEQISAQLEVSHETIYKHVYADKSLGGDLYRHLRCQKKR